jgi:invasion protein IalB
MHGLQPNLRHGESEQSMIRAFIKRFSPRMCTPYAAFAALCLLIAAAAPTAANAQVTVKSEHGFWKIICETPPGATSEQCGMHQSVRDETREELGLSITVLRPADHQGDLLRIQAPLGVLLPTGVGLEIDGQNIGTAFFVRCFADGCWADVKVDDKLLEALSSGKTAIFKFFQTPEEGVGIPVDLKGFAEAYRNLS